MTKYQFLNELDQLLHTLPEKERKEIMEDYEEHFAFAKRAEKSDSEVIAIVGTPAEIASELLNAPVDPKTSEAHQEEELRTKEAELKEKSEALAAQAAALEAKLASQAEELAARAEALSQQAEARGESFGHQVGNLVDSITATVGSALGSVSEVITESFEMDEEDLPENAVQSETLIEELIDMTGVKNVIINARNQKIEIEKTIYPTARIRLARGMLAVKVEGDTLHIESRALKRKFAFGNIITIESSTAGLEVELPEMVYGLIKAKTNNGKIEASNFELDQLILESSNGKLDADRIKANELKLKTVNGKILVESATGNIDATSTNGKIELAHITGEVVANTSNGKIELKRVSGNVVANTSNGKIEFDNKTIDHSLNLTTSNAKIEVVVEEKPENARFELSTSNAKTRLFDTERNYDVFGDGSNEVKLKSSNAKIEVYQKSDQKS